MRGSGPGGRMPLVDARVRARGGAVVAVMTALLVAVSGPTAIAETTEPATEPTAEPTAEPTSEPTAEPGEPPARSTAELGSEVETLADPVGVTLSAAPLVVRAGNATHLTGQIDPAAEGETVEVVDAATDEVLDSDLTAADGTFALDYEPLRTIALVARWATLPSDPVTVEVDSRVRASLSNVLLFGKARAAGRVQPALPGAKVKVILRRGSKTVVSRMVAVGGDGRFATRFRIRRPGRHRVIARYQHPDLLFGSDASRWKRPPLPSLGPGSRGTTVKLLERRLRSLKYYLTGLNSRFDYRTGDAVLAFHKVHGMSRIRRVTRDTWKRLAAPRRPRPQARHPRFHVEVDLSRQVLLVVRRGKVSEIIHTSTGRYPGWTRVGVFRVHRKIAGYSPGRLYYPSYFDGNRAVHGWPDVPTYPASHGCARVPYWTAIHLHRIMGHGTVVRVYH